MGRPASVCTRPKLGTLVPGSWSATGRAQAAPPPHRLPLLTLSVCPFSLPRAPPVSPLAALLCVACRTVFHPMPRPGLTFTLAYAHQKGSLAQTLIACASLKCVHICTIGFIKSPSLVCAARDNVCCGKGIVLVLPDHVRTAIGGVTHFCPGMVRPAGPSDPISGRDMKWA